jgi:hypothetical protein
MTTAERILSRLSPTATLARQIARNAQTWTRDQIALEAERLAAMLEEKPVQPPDRADVEETLP